MKYLIFFILMLVSIYYMQAQQTSPQVIATSGNVSQQSNATISYTIGETVIQTTTNGTNTLTQGYQQPHYNITLLPPYQNTLPNIQIFPNPTSDELQIKFENDQEIKTNIYLTDAAGKQIIKQSITVLPKTIVNYPMQQVATGKYFLTIELLNQKKFKTFEIIKK